MCNLLATNLSIIHKMILQGKVGVIMGVLNERSIAWSVAKGLINAGARVIFSYRGDAERGRLVKLLSENNFIQGVDLFLCDVSREDGAKNFFQQVEIVAPKLDFLIHSIANATKESLQNPLSEIKKEDFLSALDISCYSLISTIKNCVPLMPDGGSIIAFSYYGSQKVISGYGIMGIAKAALESSVRYLACELGPIGIRVNSVSPGPIKTIASSVIPNFDQMLRHVKDFSPLKKNIKGEDVANLVEFLVSDLSSSITGQNIVIDAGMSILGYGSATKKE